MHDTREDIPRSGPLAGVDVTTTVAATAMVIAFILFTVLMPDTAQAAYTSIKDFITQRLGWYYIATVNLVLLAAVVLILSPWGGIRLGRDDDRPEFKWFSWFAMLFSASVGTGLMFFSIAEPLTHMQGNPFQRMAGLEAGSLASGEQALQITLFHWGLHGWAIYILIGAMLGYFSYRRGLPLTIRSAFYPILGRRIYGPLGHAIDLLAIFATLFGTATTLGLGVAQMNAGLNQLFGLSISTTHQVVLVVIVSVLATLSVVSGLKKGIRLLSEWNIHLSMVLFAFFIIAGPTLFLLTTFGKTIGGYLIDMIPMGLWVNTDPSDQWQSWWTLFYWGWWLSWGPFVGMFIARISYGRTIRQVLLGGMAASLLAAGAWIAIFGGTALHLQFFAGVDLASLASQDLASVLFHTIDSVAGGALGTTMVGMATLMIITWFVTSADSGTLVICTILSRGEAHPPQLQRVFWGLFLGATSAVLLVAGGLQALQTAAIASALPFSVVLLLMCFCLFKALVEDGRSPSPKRYASSQQ
ncbi:BCCT family transporter [Salinicola sp. CR57]|uniref:BCCT family transporter n=1 Tax=Salinicola sp. CR57 TaxID=1949086 RepID=UPI000DA1C60C|nr:BCCT family transporter [Salinicola sp. CR57]